MTCPGGRECLLLVVGECDLPWGRECLPLVVVGECDLPLEERKLTSRGGGV